MLRKDHPDHLVDIMSAQIFRNPVTVIPSGHVYEQEMIDTVIAKAVAEGKKPECPKSRKPIEKYIPAWSMIAAVDEYLKLNPDAKEDQYVLLHPKASTDTEISASSASTVPVNSSAAASSSPAVTAAASSASSSAESAQLRNSEGLNTAAAMANLESEALRNALLSQAQAADLFVRMFQAPRPESAGVEVNRSINHEEHEARRARYLEQQRLREQEREQQRARQIELERERDRQWQLHRAAAAARAQAEADKEAAKVRLYGLDEINRKTLVDDLQNLIWALKFETGPKPQGKIQNFSLLFFALIESAFLEPLPWQKIVVSGGPTSTAMYEVLKAAIRALTELNPDVLKQAKEDNTGQYDKVKTMLGGEVSLGNGGYASFARRMGTVTNQPGYLVDQIMLRVDHMMFDLCKRHPDEVKHLASPRLRS